MGDERALQRRRAREVVSSMRCVVPELAELLARRLELGAKRAVCSRALVLEGIGAEDVDGRDHRDHSDHEHTGKELE